LAVLQKQLGKPVSDPLEPASASSRAEPG
jgi:hypothetical protein